MNLAPLSKLLQLVPDPYPLQTRKKLAEKRETTSLVRQEDFAKPSNELNLHLGEHWGIVGSTGSGKTYFTMKGLLEYLRRQYPEAKRYVLDSTDDPDMVDMVHNPLQHTGNNVPDLLRDASHTLVWTPKNGKLPEAYNRWFEQINDAREPQIVVIDEVASITGEALEGLEGMLKQLRKHGGTVVCLTQEIGKVDTTIFGQLTHFVQFFLNPKPYDMAQARNFLGISKEEQRPPRFTHGFFHRKTRGNFAMKEYRDLSEFFSTSH